MATDPTPAGCTDPCIACMTGESHDPAPPSPNAAAHAAVPSAPADADLRDRIAQAIHTNRFPDSSWAGQPEALRSEYRDIADAVLAVLPAPADRAGEGEQLRQRYTDSLRRADEVNNALMEEVQRYAEGKERPVLWSVYNEMHLRAANAEGDLERLRADRPAVLREAANGLAALGPLDSLVSAPAAWTEAIETLRRMADQIAEDDLRRVAAEAQQVEAQAAADCPYGVGPGDGSGCIKPAGHDGDHVVTAGVTVMPCSPVVRQPHMPHSWRPQPGMAYVHCPGATTEEQL